MPDSLGFLACLLGGLWIWQRLRRLGIDRLLSAVLTLTGLWFVGGLVTLLYQTLCQAWSELRASGAHVLPAIVAVTLLAILIVIGRLWWEHYRARRFFDP